MSLPEENIIPPGEDGYIDPNIPVHNRVNLGHDDDIPVVPVSIPDGVRGPAFLKILIFFFNHFIFTFLHCCFRVTLWL